MTNIDEAVRAAKKLAQQFKPLMQVGEFLAQVASLEQAEKEAAAKVEQLRDHARRVDVKLRDAQAQLTTAVLDKEGMKEYCATTKALADGEADDIRGEARVWADGHRAEANAAAAEVGRVVSEQLAEHNSFMVGAQEDAKALIDQIAALKLEISTIKNRL